MDKKRTHKHEHKEHKEHKEREEPDELEQEEGGRSEPDSDDDVGETVIVVKERDD